MTEPPVARIHNDVANGPGFLFYQNSLHVSANRRTDEKRRSPTPYPRVRATPRRSETVDQPQIPQWMQDSSLKALKAPCGKLEHLAGGGLARFTPIGGR